MTEDYIRAAIVGVLNSPARPPALKQLPRIKYPSREIYITPDSESVGHFTVQIALYYKHRGPRIPLSDNLEDIRAALDELFPSDLYVEAVRNGGTHLILEVSDETLRGGLCHDST